jgi:hypothetical protein
LGRGRRVGWAPLDVLRSSGESAGWQLAERSSGLAGAVVERGPLEGGHVELAARRGEAGPRGTRGWSADGRGYGVGVLLWASCVWVTRRLGGGRLGGPWAGWRRRGAGSLGGGSVRLTVWRGGVVLRGVGWSVDRAAWRGVDGRERLEGRTRRGDVRERGVVRRGGRCGSRASGGPGDGARGEARVCRGGARAEEGGWGRALRSVREIRVGAERVLGGVGAT